MANAMRKCRVCGKLYEACHTMRQKANTFRWQEVACSPACGSIYFARIEDSRKTDASVKGKSASVGENDKAIHNLSVDDNVVSNDSTDHADHDDIDLDNDLDESLDDEVDDYFDDEDGEADDTARLNGM